MSNILIHLPRLEDRISQAPHIKMKIPDSLPTLPDREPPDRNDYGYYRYATPLRNGRSHIRISDKKMTVKWKVPLKRNLHPNLLIGNEKGIIVQGQNQWQLFNAEGEEQVTHESRFADMAISPDGSQFGFIDRRGSLCIGDLKSGDILFRRHLSLGDRYDRPFFMFWKDGVFLQGVPIPLYPEDIPEDICKFEVLYLPDQLILHDPPKSESFDARSAGTLNDYQTLCAVCDEKLVIAARNKIILSDLDLTVLKVITGEFLPVSLSVNKSGTLYMIVPEEDQLKLFAVTEDGTQIVNCIVPQGTYLPPILSYDHSVFLVSESKCMKLSKEGKKCWQHALPSPLGGAVVTADNELVVSAGTVIARYDDKGDRHPIFNFTGENAATQPVFLKDGTVFIATESHLYHIGPEEQK